ncbi:DUF805 domain-containing protein [Gemmobacter serpentinus]|uniref:DUF805 domain-containing protein n=1 Tax=Gemmobacter serpentinus TaxID=2652247 RepID=UPI00124E1DEE|nr:DUF805 domain-containing protein [Gemmobacter serpentinus]
MDFGDAIRKCLVEKYYPLIEGRASRAEFWWLMLFYWLISTGFMVVLALIMAATILPAAMSGQEPSILTILLILPVYMATFGFGLFMMPPVVGVTIRRLHDRNISGWWFLGLMLLCMIPILNLAIMLAMLVLMLLPGTAGPNRFGADPLAPQGTGIFE